MNYKRRARLISGTLLFGGLWVLCPWSLYRFRRRSTDCLIVINSSPHRTKTRHAPPEMPTPVFSLEKQNTMLRVSQLAALVTALRGLLLKDKAWVSAALDHLRKTFLGERAGGRLPEGEGMAAPDQRRQLFGFDLGKSVGLELAPSVQQLAELLLCSQGEEVRQQEMDPGFGIEGGHGRRGFLLCRFAFLRGEFRASTVLLFFFFACVSACVC